MVLVNDPNTIKFINRSQRKEDTELKIENLSQQTKLKSLKPLPNYNYNLFPYVLIKDSNSHSLFNVRTMKSKVIDNNCPFDWDVIHTSLMDMQENPDNGIISLFTLKLERK